VNDFPRTTPGYQMAKSMLKFDFSLISYQFKIKIYKTDSRRTFTYRS